jgi:cell division protein FtsW (lipid II flippase)
MLIRISYDRAVKQFVFICIATIISMFIPSILKRVKYLRKFYFLYGFLGLFLLFMVFGIGNVTNGAKISLDLLFISVQPSEFVKISFVLFISGILYKESNFVNVFISGIIAGAHILVLVLSRDLGTALIFFLTYVFIVFVVTGKLIYLITGFTAFIGASFMAYSLFDHVKVRVMAWMDPWSIIDGRGYQVTQSLFGIGTGGFFGMGYFKGDPKLIPVVDQDFIFSAISEELGGFFALLLIFLYFNLFIVFIRIAFRCSDTFYKTTAFGLGVIMAVQVFLTIGGAIKLIPSTGVTMPLISYGGSSVVATVIIFGILQSFYINEVREGLEDGK